MGAKYMLVVKKDDHRWSLFMSIQITSLMVSITLMKVKKSEKLLFDDGLWSL
jgi:hypothetical protein